MSKTAEQMDAPTLHLAIISCHPSEYTEHWLTAAQRGDSPPMQYGANIGVILPQRDKLLR